MLLHKIGFRPFEVHHGEMLEDGRLVVPALVDGEAVRLLLDTTLCYDLAVNLGHARQHAWEYKRLNDSFGASPSRPAFALARARPDGPLLVDGSEGEADKVYYTAGRLGVTFVNHGVLALDPIAAAIGLSDVDLAEMPALDAVRLDLMKTTVDRLPVTVDLVDEYAPHEKPRFMISTARPDSAISLEYVERAWGKWWRRRRARRAAAASTKIDVCFRIPAGELAWQRVTVLDEPRDDQEQQLGTIVDGYLGLDFLYRWLPVIDFGRAALWLVPLDGAL